MIQLTYTDIQIILTNVNMQYTNYKLQIYIQIYIQITYTNYIYKLYINKK